MLHNTPMLYSILCTTQSYSWDAEHFTTHPWHCCTTRSCDTVLVHCTTHSYIYAWDAVHFTTHPWHCCTVQCSVQPDPVMLHIEQDNRLIVILYNTIIFMGFFTLMGWDGFLRADDWYIQIVRVHPTRLLGSIHSIQRPGASAIVGSFPSYTTRGGRERVTGRLQDTMMHPAYIAYISQPAEYIIVSNGYIHISVGGWMRLDAGCRPPSWQGEECDLLDKKNWPMLHNTGFGRKECGGHIWWHCLQHWVTQETLFTTLGYTRDIVYNIGLHKRYCLQHWVT